MLKTSMYTAYVLTPAARAKLLEAFPPKFPDVIAHHATLKFGVPKDAEAPAPAELMAVGYASDESLEAVVVSVDGSTERPDGSTYHITLSLDRSKGRKPVDSNKVVQAGWEPIAEPFAIETLPQKLAMNEPKKASHTNSEGFWAGEGNAASGILPVCPSKGTVCLAMRSSTVHMGECWGTIGGAIMEGMSPAESAKKELAEETGYTGGLTLIPAYVFTSGGGFKYFNYIGILPTEFSLHPQKGGTGKLKHSDETDYISWVPWQNVLDDVAKTPDDYHPGMRKMLVESKDEIERALQIPKTAAKPTSSFTVAWGKDKWTVLGKWITDAKNEADAKRQCRQWLKDTYQVGMKVLYATENNPKTAATPRMAPEPPVKPLTRQQVKKMVDDAANATYEAPETLDPTQTPEFKRWFGRSKVVNSDGTPRVVYHGSTHVFEKFDISRANAEGYYGKGFYFTDSKVDVSRNYGTPKGPDLLRNIEFRAEKILNEIQDEMGEYLNYGDPRYDELEAQAMLRARDELTGPTQGVVYLTYLKIERPLIVKSSRQTRFEVIYDEDTGNETGSGVKLWQACINAGDDLGTDGQGVWTRAMEHIGDSEFSAEQFENAVRKDDEMIDDEVMVGTFLASVYQNMGFDGIIMQNVDKQFSNMGISAGTSHYIVWNPRQIKSALGNSGKFSPRSPRMTAGISKKEFEGSKSIPHEIMAAFEGQTRWEKMLETEEDKWIGPAWENLRKDPWVEFVPISQLLPLREYEWDREYNRHGVDQFDELVEDTERHGVREPITIRYFPDTNRAIIIEGNHRVSAAEKAGFSDVPARVTIASYKQDEYGHATEGGPVRGRMTKEKPHQDYIKPSDIGLSGSKTTKSTVKTAAEHPVWHDGKFLCPCGQSAGIRRNCPVGCGGNSSEEGGFVACDRQGNRIDPVKWNETKYYLCTDCRRIFKKIGKEGENNDGRNDVVIGFGTHKDQQDLDFDLLKKDAAIRTPFGPRELTVHNPKRGMRIRHGATKIPGTIVKVLHGENEGDVEIKWDKTPWNLGRTGIYALWSLEPEGEFTPNLKFEASTT